MARDVHPNRYYVVMDCCSNEKTVDEKAEKRVKEAVSQQKSRDFGDKLVEIYAAPSGFTATAETGKTLTSALVSVLEESWRNGEVGVPMHELELRLREEQNKQGSSNTPSVKVPSRLWRERFPL